MPKVCPRLSQTKFHHLGGMIGIKYPYSLRTIGFWLLLEKGKLIFFNGVTPDILVTLQGRTHT